MSGPAAPTTGWEPPNLEPILDSLEVLPLSTSIPRSTAQITSLSLTQVSSPACRPQILVRTSSLRVNTQVQRSSHCPHSRLSQRALSVLVKDIQAAKRVSVVRNAWPRALLYPRYVCL